MNKNNTETAEVLTHDKTLCKFSGELRLIGNKDWKSYFIFIRQ